MNHESTRRSTIEITSVSLSISDANRTTLVGSLERPPCLMEVQTHMPTPSSARKRKITLSSSKSTALLQLPVIPPRPLPLPHHGGRIAARHGKAGLKSSNAMGDHQHGYHLAVDMDLFITTAVGDHLHSEVLVFHVKPYITLFIFHVSLQKCIFSIASHLQPWQSRLYDSESRRDSI